MKKLLIILSAVLTISCSNGLTCNKDGKVHLNGKEVGRIEAEAPEGIRSSFKATASSKDLLKIEWNFEALEDIDSVSINAAFIHECKADWWMIPSVSYNGNEWGRGKEPKGAREDGKWRTWSYLRTPVPGAVYSEGPSYATATWSDVPATTEDAFSCSVEPDSTSTTHRIIWPEQEMPGFYHARDRHAKGWARKEAMKKGERHSITMYLCVNPIEKEHRAMSHFLKHSWEAVKKEDFAAETADSTIWNLGVRYFKESLWAEEGPYRGFSIGLHRYGDHFEQRRDNKYESGWCGQNISISNSLLTDYLKNGDRSSLDKAMACLDCWAKHCPLDNGLFITHFDSILYGHEPVMDACNLGTTAMNYFEAYELAQRCGYERPEWLKIAYGICDFARAHQDERGCYARGWKSDGSMIVRDGTVGCFLLYPMTKAYELSGKTEYLESAEKAYAHYTGELMSDGYTTAGALDTWCIDKESAISILRGALSLYRISGKEKYLDEAVHCSYYLSTWLWHYNAGYPENDQFTKWDFHTLGMTSVSVQHHHLDDYACLWVADWYKLSELTGDPQWASKAEAIWRASCQLISDGTLVVNGLQRPAGGQNEASFQCGWNFRTDRAYYPTEKEMPQRINDWLVAWPGAFRLETMRRMGR